MTNTACLDMNAVVFDLGKVLLDWDPGYFYASYFPQRSTELEYFLSKVVPQDWIVEMDGGKPAAIAMAERSRAFPDHAELIGLWAKGWPAMLRGEIQGTARIIRELKKNGVRLYALTNFSRETFPIALERFQTLALFEHIVVSGEIGLVKPDPRIYTYTNERCGLNPESTVFIDDSVANVDAGKAAGWHALQFTSASALRAELAALQLISAG